MKKACKIIKYIFLLFVFSCLIFFNTGCGLDTIYVIDSPTITIHKPEHGNNSQDEQYFEFWTNEGTDVEGFTFQGTEIYYKIYNNSSTMISEVKTLQGQADNSDKSSTVANTMIDSYHYKPLKVAGNYSTPLIQRSTSNQRVYIRLSDYQSSYPAELRVNDNYLNGAGNKTIPVRNIDELTFNFGRNGPKDKRPLEADEDVKFVKSDVDDGKWYVSMFAVAIGHDFSYANYYSNILYLGSVTINALNYDN